MQVYRPSIFLLCFLLIGFSGSLYPANAQGGESCPTFVQTAMETVDQSCAGLSRDELCYGHTHVDVTFRQPRDPSEFDAPADRVLLVDVQSIISAPLDLVSGVWGISVLNLRANLPETVPGQNVMFLLMGSATLENAVTPSDLSFGPMQVFYFTTGLDAPHCSEAPNALVIQNFEGTSVALRINDLDIQFGSTVVFTLSSVSGQPVMIATLLRGHLQMAVRGTIVILQQTEALPQAFPTVAITLNDQGRVDAASQFIPLVGDALVPPVQAACAIAATMSILSPGIDVSACAAQLADSASGTESAVCTITATRVVNLRAGPGTTYPVMGQLTAGQTMTVTGRAEGTDGSTWWQLSNGGWVRSDLVQASGQCSNVAMTNAPGSDSSGHVSAAAYEFEMAQCQAGQVTGIVAGQQVRIHQGVQRVAAIEEAQVTAAGSYPILMDGVLLPTIMNPITFEQGNTNPLGIVIPPGYDVSVYADWVATPGTHTAVGHNAYGPLTCTFDVQSP